MSNESPTHAYSTEDETPEPKPSFSSQFWELFKQSVIMQGILSIMVVATWMYLVIAGKTIGDEVYLVLGTVVGFFFGGKMGYSQGKEAARTTK